MSDLGLSIAASGVNADQTALDTIAQNLANADTPGYVTETANLTAMPSGDTLGVGGGVNVYSVTQQSDGLLQSTANQTAAGLAQVSALQQTLEEAQDAFPVSTTSGMSTDLSSFWNSWDTIASDPTSAAGYQEVVADAQDLQTDYESATSQLAEAASSAGSQLTSTVSTVNTLLGEVASLNTQILNTSSQGSTPNALLDQQNELMTELATDIGATGQVQSNGTLQVSVGGVTLVQGSSAGSLAVQDPPSTSNALSGQSTYITASLPTSSGKSVSVGTVSPSSGTAAGLLTAINSNLPKYQTQLNQVMYNLATQVNTQLADGANNSGTSGSTLPDLFDIATDPSTGASYDLNSADFDVQVDSYYSTNPTDLAVASTTSYGDDGSNAETIADLGSTATTTAFTWTPPTTSTTGNTPASIAASYTGGADDSYDSLVESVGDDVSSVTSQVSAQTSANNAAQESLESVSGVDQNDQLVALMNFQNSYQASAKVINTMDEALQSLLAAV